MPAAMRARIPLLVPAAALAAAIAGCGGGGGSSPADLAAFAPPESPIYFQVMLRPPEPTKANVNSIAKRVGGIDDLGEFVVSKLEESARDSGESFDFEKEVEPWLGERAAILFTGQGLDNEDADFVIESTDPQRTQSFIDSQARSSRQAYTEATYKGVHFKVGGKDDNALGVVDGALVRTPDEKEFQQIVDATSEESLADEKRFQDAFSATNKDSFADAYVDIGGLVKRSKEEFDPETVSIFKSLGVNLTEATAVASVLPGSDQVEVDLSSDLVGGGSTNGSTTELLGSLPGDSFAALGVSGFGGSLEHAIDGLDANGIPPQVPPHQLKRILKSRGIDLDEIASSVKDAALFAVGTSRPSLGGALVMTTEDSQRAENTVANIGLLLRIAGTGGVAPLRGSVSGFSVHGPGLGAKPIVIAAKGERMAIGYGRPATLTALSGESANALSQSTDYQAAVASLGDTPIGGFADGSAALKLAESLLPRSDSGFREAKRYLRSIRYIAAGSEEEGEKAAAKLIVGLAK
jgi:uncharacterized protein DUF3352